MQWGREITKDDIDLLVTKNLETTVFVVGSALMAGNYDKAYQQLDLLFYQKGGAGGSTRGLIL